MDLTSSLQCRLVNDIINFFHLLAFITTAIYKTVSVLEPAGTGLKV